MFHKLLLLCLLLAGCAPSSPFVWQDDTVDLTWPESSESSRIRYLRSLSGYGDFDAGEEKARAFEWWFGKEQVEGALYTPFAVSVNESGQVWVADSGAAAVFVIDTADRDVRVYYSIDDFSFVSPSGVTVDDRSGRVFVSDSAYNSIFVLDFEGELIARWQPPGGFSRPSGMAVGHDGRLLVADAGAGEVFLFAPDGTFIKSVRSLLSEDGRFRRPLSVAFGPNGEVLILDAFSFWVEVQSNQGELLGTIGSLGDAPGYFARPRGLAVDTDGHVFVSDAAFDNVQVFDMAGNLLTFWGGNGASAGKFNLPAGLFVDKQRRIFVADSYNHRVQVYQLLQ